MFYLFRDSASYFPQLYDFSHLHVLEGAEFTHAHWAELTRVLQTEVDWNLVTDTVCDTVTDTVTDTVNLVTDTVNLVTDTVTDTVLEQTTLASLLQDAEEKPEGIAPASPTDDRIQLDKVLVHLDSLDIGWLKSLMKTRGC